MNNPRQIQTRKMLMSLMVMTALSSASAMTNEFVDEVVSPTPTAKPQHDIRGEAVPPAPTVDPKQAASLDANYLYLLNHAKSEKRIHLGMQFTADVIDEIPDLETVSATDIPVESLRRLGELKSLKTLGLMRVNIPTLAALPVIDILEMLQLSSMGKLSLQGIESQRNLKFLMIDDTELTSLEPLMNMPKLVSVTFCRPAPKITEDSRVLADLKKKGVKIYFQ